MPRGSGRSPLRWTAPVLALALVLLVAGVPLPAASGNAPWPASPWGGVARTAGTPMQTEQPAESTTRPAAPVRAQQAGSGPDGSSQWVLTFSDEFDGSSLDKGRWTSGFGWGPTTRSDYGWCNPANNVVSGGVLVQRIERDAKGPDPWSVGCVHSKDKFAQQYGYWEARIRSARCYGARTAFWGKPNDESWPPELDVVEVNGDGPAQAKRAKFTLHWQRSGRHLQSQGEYAGPDFSDDFHVFGAEWTPEGTTFFVDGVERFHTAAGAKSMDDGGSFYTILNSQVILRDSMCGDIPARSASYVDWVRVWTPAPIKPAPPVGPPEDGAPQGSDCRFPVRVQAESPLPPGSGEASGAVASQRLPGVGWFIRDSGNPASLYSFRLNGGGSPRVHEVAVTGATNKDWEDLVYDIGPDGRGRLFIIESGQSGGDAYIYEVPEPSPDAARTAPAKRYRYTYPDIGVTNTESAFMVGRYLALVTKTAPGRIYRFDLSQGGVKRGRYMGPLVDADRVSVVRLSADRRTMVAASHTQAFVYEGLPPVTPIAGVVGKKPNRITRIDKGVNVEAGDWFPNGSCQLLLLAENRNIYRLRLGQPPQ